MSHWSLFKRGEIHNTTNLKHTVQGRLVHHRVVQPPSFSSFTTCSSPWKRSCTLRNHLPSPPSPHPVSTTNLRSVSLDLPALVISFLSVWLRSLNSLFFLALLGLHCSAWAFSSCGECRLLFIAVRGLLIAMVSFVAEHWL